MSFFQNIMAESKGYNNAKLEQSNHFDDQPKIETQDLAFIYDNADCFSAEIAELYSYTEEPEFRENQQLFESSFAKFSLVDPRWFHTSPTVHERYMYHLLEELESVDKVKRSQAVRCLLYLLQGVFNECLTTSEELSEQQCLQAIWSRRNVFLALRCGAYACVLQVLLLEIKYNSWASANYRRNTNPNNAPRKPPHHPPLIATCLVDSRDLRAILAVLYTMVETVRCYSEASGTSPTSHLDESGQENASYRTLAATFLQELDEPIGTVPNNTNLTTILFNMVHRFCLGHNPNFPVKKILLLLWKVLLVILGGVTSLIDQKNRLRAALNLPPITEPETHVIVRERMRASSPPPMAADLLDGVGGGGRGSPPRNNAGLSQAGRAGRQGGKGPKRGSLAGGKHRPLESHEDTAKNTLMLFGAMFMNDSVEGGTSCDGITSTGGTESGEMKGSGANMSGGASDRGDSDNGNGKEEEQDGDDGDEEEDDSLSTASDVTVIEAEDAEVAIEGQKTAEEDESPVLVDEVEELEAETQHQQQHSPSAHEVSSSTGALAEGASVSPGANGLGIGTPRPGSPVNMSSKDGGNEGSVGGSAIPGTPLPGGSGGLPFKVLHPPPSDGESEHSGGSLFSAHEQQHRASLSSASEQEWLLKSQLFEERMKGLAWRPKIHQRDLEVYIQHVRSKFIGLQAPGDTMSLFGLPRPIHEAIGVLRDHLYISLAEAQIKREQDILQYPFSKGRENIPDTVAERLYRSLLPNLNGYLIALLKILLAAAPTSRTKTESINILAEIVPEEMPTNITQSLKLSVDVNRHKEIIAKCVSAILLLLMKHWKLNHVYQFEHLAQTLVLINCVPLLLKFINQNVLQYAQAKNTLTQLDFPNCVLRESLALDEHKESEDPTFCCWRNMFTCINFMRILNKIIKWKNGRIVMLVVFKSAPILKRVLKVRHALLQLYTLKLLKLQTRYFGRQWRKTNMATVSAIYQKVRHGLTDDWAFGNEVDTGSQDFHGEELALKQSIDRFNCRRYLAPSPVANGQYQQQSAGGMATGNAATNPMIIPRPGSMPPFLSSAVGSTVDNCLTSLLNSSVELPEHFKRNYLQWLEDEVFAQPIDWDHVLAPQRLL